LARCRKRVHRESDSCASRRVFEVRAALPAKLCLSPATPAPSAEQAHSDR
jgi:hypothetical protein